MYPINLTFDRRHLKAALVCSAKSDIRNYLNGALLELGAGEHSNTAVIVATDGHRMSVSVACATDAVAPAQVIIPRTLIEQVCKHKTERHVDDTVTVSIDTTQGAAGDEVHIGVKMPDGTQYLGVACDTRFPDWRRVTRQTRGNGKASLIDPVLYAGIGEFFKALAGSKTARITDGLAIDYESDGAATSVVMATRASEQAYFAVMPMRQDEQDFITGRSTIESICAFPVAQKLAA